MANIQDAINNIKSVNYGGYLRNDIAKALEAINEQVVGMGTVYSYKGSVASALNLPTTPTPKAGDAYNVEDTGKNYAWNGESWDDLGGIFNNITGDFTVGWDLTIGDVTITAEQLTALLALLPDDNTTPATPDDPAPSNP